MSERSGGIEPEALADDVSDDVSAGDLLREVARIEDVALSAHDLVRLGDLLGPYRIVRRLGHGAMGVVYEAEDRQLSRGVALKVLAPSRAGDDERRRRFRREARAASAVVHPNVAAVYGVGHERGLDYLALEYVAGVTLREVMRRRGGAFEIANAARIGEAIASGVGRAHELGIVHRDLKPENVMITDTGVVKVLDFGLAKLVTPPEGARDELDRSNHTMTLDGRILGTPAYMSPEQSKGRPVDARTDVFALGVLLYELATGRRPFCGETPVELFIAIDRDEPPPPSALNPHVPPSLEAIVLRCLCKSPEQRFASCQEVAEALRHVSSGEDTVLAAVASDAELRLASIVRVVLPPADPPADPPAAARAQERAALADLLAGYGAHGTALVGGALVATFLQRPTGAGAATDLAVQAARCAFAARDAVPDAAIAVATGRALMVGSTPTGEAADRAAALAAESTAAEIVLDELSAGLLDGRCRVRELGAGGSRWTAPRSRPMRCARSSGGRRRAWAATRSWRRSMSRSERAATTRYRARCWSSAPPGQGKTRLLREWLRRTEAGKRTTAGAARPRRSHPWRRGRAARPGAAPRARRGRRGRAGHGALWLCTPPCAGWCRPRTHCAWRSCSASCAGSRSPTTAACSCAPRAAIHPRWPSRSSARGSRGCAPRARRGQW